jgi:spore germination protein YaaH
VDNYVPRESTTHYDREEQGVVADYVIIMGYDEHWGSGGVAGSVASIGFVEDGIEKTVAGVPANKVINGIPFYTRVWKTRNGEVTSEALDMETAQNFITNNQITLQWDEDTCQNYGEIQKGDTLYQIWMEDRQSIETKLNIMRKYDLGGVAEWKLGFETSDVWDVISDYVNE